MQEQEIFDHIEAGRHQNSLPGVGPKTCTWVFDTNSRRKGLRTGTRPRWEKNKFERRAQMNHPEMVRTYASTASSSRRMYSTYWTWHMWIAVFFDCQINYWDGIGDQCHANRRKRRAQKYLHCSIPMSPTECHESGRPSLGSKPRGKGKWLPMYCLSGSMVLSFEGEKRTRNRS